MQKENEQNTINGIKYESTFAFRLVGTLISHDKRFFETVKHQLEDWMPFMLTHEIFNDVEERQAFFELMMVLNELANITKNISDDELDQQFKQILNLLGFKKESEVQHA